MLRLVTVLVVVSTVVNCATDHLVMLQSSPFDSFRLECPKMAGLSQMSIKMVESAGLQRRDVLFELKCDSIDSLFPWFDMPDNVQQLEREDCYWSRAFDPIIGQMPTYSCRQREYIAGLSRIVDTKIQMLCCRVRSRDEVNCFERLFAKPLGDHPPHQLIESDQKTLINAMAVEENAYRIRFCQLQPRPIDHINADILTTTTTVARPPTTRRLTTAATTTITTTNPLPTTTTTTTETMTTQEPTSIENEQQPTERTRRVIYVTRPPAKIVFRPGDNRQTVEPSNEESTNNNNVLIDETMTDDDTELVDESQNQSTDRTVSIKDDGQGDTIIYDDDGSDDELVLPPQQPSASDENQNNRIAGIRLTNVDKALTLTNDEIEFDRKQTAHRDKEQSITKTGTNIIHEQRTITTDQLPIETTSRRRTQDEVDIEWLAKLYISQAAAITTTPTTTVITTTTVASPPLPTLKSKSSSKGKQIDSIIDVSRTSATRVDEDTAFSPFEARSIAEEHQMDVPSKVRNANTSSNLRRAPSSVHHGGPVWVPPEPLPLPAGMVPFNGLPGFSSDQLVDVDMPTFDDEQFIRPGSDYAELPGDFQDVLTKAMTDDKSTTKTKNDTVDATKTYVPPKTQNYTPHRSSTPGLIVFDTKSKDYNPELARVVAKNRAQFNAALRRGLRPQTVPTTTTVAVTTVSRRKSNTGANRRNKDMVLLFDAEYPPADDVVTTTDRQQHSVKVDEIVSTSNNNNTSPSRKKVNKMKKVYKNRQKVQERTDAKKSTDRNILTFCTKDIATRDESGLIIACGDDNGIWSPARCPAETDCFIATDATYRICCTVSRG